MWINPTIPHHTKHNKLQTICKEFGVYSTSIPRYVQFSSTATYPDSKVLRVNMDPSGADRTQVGPCWPHELWYLSTFLCDGNLELHFSVSELIAVLLSDTRLRYEFPTDRLLFFLSNITACTAVVLTRLLGNYNNNGNGWIVPSCSIKITYAFWASPVVLSHLGQKEIPHL